MRAVSSALFLLGVSVTLAGCSVELGTSDSPSPSNTPPPSDPPAHTPNEAELPPAPQKQPDPPPPVVEDDGTYREVVHVYMRSRIGQLWYCTGTLVSARTVVTAAHCLDTDKFVSYEIIAPLAPKAPRVAAKNPKVFGGPFSDVANPDIGFLTLDRAVDLPRYGVLTDVVAQVEAGEPTESVAVVRVDQDPDADFAPTDTMPVSSTVKYGYEHGFGTPMFSKGGDSGAGLFLVEAGKPTHKLIGVARQPEPDRNLDHFTRIDAGFIAFFNENGGGQ